MEEMPEGVQLMRRKLSGSRLVVRNRRLYGGVRTFKANWPEAGLQELENHKMLCVLGGQVDFQMGKFAVQCGDGFFLIIPPGTPHPSHTTSPNQNTFCDLLTIVLHAHAIQCFLTHWQPGWQQAIFLENYLFRNHRLAELFRFLMEETTENQENATSIGSELLAAFLMSLQREVRAGHFINPGPLGRPEVVPEKLHDNGDFKAELLHYVQRHLNQPLTVESVARGLFLSRTQFILRVRQETGKSFIQFLTDYRIEEAKTLLKDSDWTINAIAGFLGFKSANYFQAVFRRSAGETPGVFRKRMRSQ